MMEPLEQTVQSRLREQRMMSQNEVAYSAGDLVVIVDVVTDTRRVLGKMHEVLSENNRRLIKG